MMVMQAGPSSSLVPPLDSLSLDSQPFPTTPFTVPTTGAHLTPLSAVPLISEVCQLIRTDAYSGLQTPDYTCHQHPLGWSCELKLPSIAAFGQRTSFTSPPLPSKTEAKQHCAFQAAMALYQAGGLTDEFKPKRVSRRRSEGLVDASGRTVAQPEAEEEPSVTINFPNPFGNASSPSSDVFLHAIELREEREPVVRLGLVCGARLEGFERGVLWRGADGKVEVSLVDAKRMEWPEKIKKERLDQLQYFNNISLGVTLNKKLLVNWPAHPSLWTPLTTEGDIDWDLVVDPLITIEQDGVSLSPNCLIVVPNARPSTRLFRFIVIRDDVDTLSPTDQVETAELGLSKNKMKMVRKYKDYQHYANIIFDADLDRDVPAPILQGRSIPTEATNMLVPSPESPAEPTEPSMRNFPLSLCRLSRLPEWWWQIMTAVPSLERLIHDRASIFNSLARLGLPKEIDVELAVLALTPTNANTGYDYQTYEFYGDSVLKLLTTVHLFLSQPRTDEGVLSALRQNSIGNLFLRGRAMAVGLDTAVLPPLFRTVSWVPPHLGPDAEVEAGEAIPIPHTIAYKVLSDAAEAMLGVAWLSGGLPVALAMADKLGMCTGGTMPWGERKELDDLLEVSHVVGLPAGSQTIQARLGYEFRHPELLVIALTHRSYISATGYHLDRLEFLGDALLEFYVTLKLHDAFPEGSERSLTFVRARAVSGSTISYIALKKLGVQEHLLHSSPLLPRAMAEAVEDAEQISWADVAQGLMTWLFDPPKVLGDAVEALIGAVWVDSRGSLEAVFAVLDGLYDELMPKYEVAELRDPVTQLHMGRQSLHCTALENTVSQQNSPPVYTAVWKWHGRALGTATATSSSVALQLAAKEALSVLVAKIDEARGRNEDPCACVGAAREEKEERKAQKALAKELAREQAAVAVAGPMQSAA